MARTEAEISLALKNYQIANHPRLRDFTPLSVLTQLNGAMASQVRYVEQQNDAVAVSLSIWTATGEKLDKLIKDRLLDGRYTGDCATGVLTFSRLNAAEADFFIPAGTRVAAPNDLGESVVFETTEDGTLLTGQTSVDIAAKCTQSGILGNAPAGTINKLLPAITGIERAVNLLDFTGGTEAETDEELRDRYVLAGVLPGTATLLMVQEHLNALEKVRESKVWSREEGDVDVICDYTDGIAANSNDIDNCLEANLAAGAVSRGILTATLAPNAFSLGDCYGGKIWIRARQHITANLNFQLTYLDNQGRTRTATVTTSAITPRGTAFLATLQAPTDRAVVVTASTYAGSSKMDVLLGMGVYPRLYNLPEHVPVAVAITLRVTETPETGLSDNIEASIKAFLNSFKIGISMDWSDLFKVVNNLFVSNGADGEVTVGRAFQGIDAITALSATATGQTADGLNEVIDVEDDARIEAGEVNVTVVT